MFREKLRQMVVSDTESVLNSSISHRLKHLVITCLRFDFCVSVTRATVVAPRNNTVPPVPQLRQKSIAVFYIQCKYSNPLLVAYPHYPRQLHDDMGHRTPIPRIFTKYIGLQLRLSFPRTFFSLQQQCDGCLVSFSKKTLFHSQFIEDHHQRHWHHFGNYLSNYSMDSRKFDEYFARNRVLIKFYQEIVEQTVFAISALTKGKHKVEML